MLDARFWILGAGCWILDAGFWMGDGDVGRYEKKILAGKGVDGVREKW